MRVVRSLAMLALGVILPWRLLLAVLKRLARRVANQLDVGPDLDPGSRRDLIARTTLYRMIEEVDLALVNVRGSAWFERWVTREGPPWPDVGPFLVLTFHYGAGLWSLSDLGCEGRRVAFVHASLPPPPDVRPGFGDHLVQARLNAVARLGNGVTITVGGAARRAEEWLAGGGVVLGLIDAPHYGRRRSMNVDVMGRTLAFPSGLVELAIRSSVPIYLYTMGLDGDGPKRLLSVAGPFRPARAQDLARDLGVFFSAAVCRDSAAWEFRTIADQAFPRMPNCAVGVHEH